MKKILSVLLAAAMTMSMTMTAFAAEDPAALLDRVTQKSATMDSMDCDMGVHAVMVMESNDPEYADLNMTLNMDMMMKLQMDQINSGNIRYKAETATEFLGQNVYSVIFYKDGYYYVDTDGQKIKYPMDLSSVMEAAKQSTATSELTSSMMKSLSLRDEGENRILSYEADPAKMNAYMDEALDSLLGNIGMDLKIREVKGEYTINKDDYYTAMNMYMVMQMSEGDETLTMIILLEADVNNPGQPVEVVLPSTDGYQSIDDYYNSYYGGSSSSSSKRATGPGADYYY